MIATGGKLYDTCLDCGKLIRINKPIFGSWHFCLTEQELREKRESCYAAARFQDVAIKQAVRNNLGDWATPHVAGCKWQRQQAESMRNVANDPTYQNAANAANRPVSADETKELMQIMRDGLPPEHRTFTPWIRKPPR